MSRTYKATGINLKSMPMGETDRLLTILTPEFGLIRVIAPGSRKHQSPLRGRSELFVVNELLIAKGRSLDKITQAETVESYPGLAKNLSKLAASQYLAELVLYQALSEQPQTELFEILNEHLRRLENLPNKTSDNSLVLAHLSHGIFHVLALSGIAPQVHICCLTKQPLAPDFNAPDWRVGFSIESGGIVNLAPEGERARGREGERAREEGSSYQLPVTNASTEAPLKINFKLKGVELALFQQLAGRDLDRLETLLPSEIGEPYQALLVDRAWLAIEKILRQYTQYQLGRAIRSASLVDACFAETMA
ncbi:MAG: DNA repair protein RecO [Cyanosarcina radialis HA8281-LM2]|jgi:DNA repair protein RecO (recombination protein O)|nr:DNA repair protein RecO [Cyanosarcina radialis HA8281-LM2]